MGTSRPGTQAPAERKAAEAELKGLIAALAPDHRRLVASMRRTLRTRLPSAHEVVYEYRDCVVISYSPSGNGYEGVMAIRAGEEGVTLHFQQGRKLPDPEKLLRGKGGQVRSIDVEGARTLSRPAVAQLIEAAIKLNRVPFARTGSGSVTVRPTAAKRRRSSRSS